MLPHYYLYCGSTGKVLRAETFILVAIFPRACHGMDSLNVVYVGRRLCSCWPICVLTSVVFTLLPYKKGRSSDKLGQGAVSPASSAWSLDFRSSQRCLGQLLGGTPKHGEDGEYSGLRVASCLWHKKACHILKPNRIVFSNDALCYTITNHVQLWLNAIVHVCPCCCDVFVDNGTVRTMCLLVVHVWE